MNQKHTGVKQVSEDSYNLDQDWKWTILNYVPFVDIYVWNKNYSKKQQTQNVGLMVTSGNRGKECYARWHT